ncbi:MAG: hydroxymethylglutaryl-CoA lyase [Acidiferrobacterales bacterium]
MSGYPRHVKLVEVGPRDGLQNEPSPIETRAKVELIDRLSHTGLRTIEATSFVSPKWVPQLADAEEVLKQITRKEGVVYPVLVPNMSGLERALGVGAEEIAVFTTASETFSQKNTNCSIAESIERFKPVIARAHAESLRVRAYISCVLGCPYEGTIDPMRVAELAQQLYERGCYEISLGDTIGVGTPRQAVAMVASVAAFAPIEHLAVHFHDTRGQALANILACLPLGVSIVDASVSGLGGCPYANGATGNVATEDVVYMLQGMDIETGVDLGKLIETSIFISNQLGRDSQSRVTRAQVGVRSQT